MQVLRHELSGEATARRCSKCAEPAKYVVYLPSRSPAKKDGPWKNFDRSSRRFACSKHGER